jgi:hypothetical protein
LCLVGAQCISREAEDISVVGWVVCRLKKLDGDAVLEQAQAGRMGGALAGAVEELVRHHTHIWHAETCTYRFKGGLSTHEGRLVWLVQVKCEKEDQASSLEPLSFTKELKINDIDFVQDFQRYEGHSAVLTTSNALDHDPFSGLLVPPRPRMSPVLDPLHFRHCWNLKHVPPSARLEPLLSLERASKCQDCPRLPAQYAHVDRVRRLEAKQERLKHMLSNEALTLFPDFQQRLGGTACLAK